MHCCRSFVRPVLLPLLSLLLVLASAPSARALQVFESFNETNAPGNAFWVNDTIGWYWTPGSDVLLAGVQTRLRTASNIDNDFTFTTTLYTDRPAVGGAPLGSFSWNGTDFVDGVWLGGTFASPIALTGGTPYFVGFAGWAQAVGSLGADSGAGINWVFPLGPDVEDLGAGSSYTGATFQTQLNPNPAGGPSTTDAGVLRFIAVPEPGSLILVSGALLGWAAGCRRHARPRGAGA